jgi:hypothetical protein
LYRRVEENAAFRSTRRRCALQSMLQKDQATDYVFHQADGNPVESDSRIVPFSPEAVRFETTGSSYLASHVRRATRTKGFRRRSDPRSSRHHSVTLTEKYYAHLVPGNLKSAAQKTPTSRWVYPRVITQNVTQNGFCTRNAH